MINLRSDARILIQGITQPLALDALLGMTSYGMQLVAGVSAGSGNQSIHEIPTFDLVEQAIAAQGAIDSTIIFNPAYQVLDAALEAMAAGISQIVIATGGVPPLDLIELLRRTQHQDVWILGSGSAGLIVPGQILLGMLDASFFSAGAVGIISRSHSLIYEVAELLNSQHLGQSLVVHLGSDSIQGSTSSQWLKAFGQETQQILLLGDITIDQDLLSAAALINQPVIVYNPQIQTEIAPITDAARLLRVGQGLEGQTDGNANIKIVTALRQIPELLKASEQFQTIDRAKTEFWE